MTKLKPSIRINNFDLIRLVAAAQVALHHSLDYLKLRHTSAFVDAVDQFAGYFPGVPIFFFVSGFLISKSWESSSTWGDYARNRLLRIYPALVLCTLLGIGSVFALGYLPHAIPSVKSFLTWVVAQMTFVQFFNPDFMRDYGVGVLNGSLWTISVELQFYLMIPIVYFLCDLRTRRGIVTLVLVILASLVANSIYWRFDPDHNEAFALKLFGVTFVPWIYMFLIGLLAQRHFNRLHELVAGRALFFLVIYLAAAVPTRLIGWTTANDINPVLYLLLVALVLSAAFTAPTLAERLLFRNDISYGIYVFHMPVVNALIYLGWTGDVRGLPVVLSITAVVATLSWLWVERPCLSLKRSGLGHNVQPHGASTSGLVVAGTPDARLSYSALGAEGAQPTTPSR